MQVTREDLISKWIMVICLMFFTMIYFNRVLQPGYLVDGDTVNGLATFSYQYSGFERGEYPFWNPLVRTGESQGVMQIILNLASPISNGIILICVFLGIKNIVFAFSLFLYTTILIYVFGVYTLLYFWTENRSAAVLGFILSLSSSTVFWHAYMCAFVLILHTVPWIIYALVRYIQDFEFRYLAMLVLSGSIFLYSYYDIS